MIYTASIYLYMTSKNEAEARVEKERKYMHNNNSSLRGYRFERSSRDSKFHPRPESQMRIASRAGFTYIASSATT
jgi:hypothetical protein